MKCHAKKRDGSVCGAEATEQFSVFPCCPFHKTYAAAYSMERSKDSYMKGYNKGYADAKENDEQTDVG